MRRDLNTCGNQIFDAPCWVSTDMSILPSEHQQKHSSSLQLCVLVHYIVLVRKSGKNTKRTPSTSSSSDRAAAAAEAAAAAAAAAATAVAVAAEEAEDAKAELTSKHLLQYDVDIHTFPRFRLIF